LYDKRYRTLMVVNTSSAAECSDAFDWIENGRECEPDCVDTGAYY